MSVSPSSFSQSTHRDVDNPRLRVPPVGTEHGTNCSLHLSPGASPPLPDCSFLNTALTSEQPENGCPNPDCTGFPPIFRNRKTLLLVEVCASSQRPPRVYSNVDVFWFRFLQLLPVTCPMANSTISVFFFFQQHQHRQPFPLSFFGLLW